MDPTNISDKSPGKPIQFSIDEVLGLLNKFEDSVVIFDNKWRYKYLNKVGWRVLNMPQKDVLEKNVWQLLPHLKGSQFEKAAKKAMATQEVTEIEEYYPHRQMWGHARFYPSKTLLLVQITDITELKKEKHVNDQLFGDLHMAMEAYWSDQNRKRRESKSKTL